MNPKFNKWDEAHVITPDDLRMSKMALQIAYSEMKWWKEPITKYSVALWIYQLNSFEQWLAVGKPTVLELNGGAKQ